MLRPVSLLPALVAAASVAIWLGLPLAAPADAAAAPAKKARTAAEPLAITIDSLSPSTVPRHGPVRVSGSVTNTDDQTWTTVKLYAFMSLEPMTTEAELEAAVQTDEDQYVGDRILAPGFDTIKKLAPGEKAQYSVTVPHRALTTNGNGVYWFGIHALGQSDQGRDNNADGRARTLIPLVPDNGKTEDTALVVPVRRAVRHASNGRITGVDAWATTLSTEGRLRSLVDFGVAAGARPITWLVDPAVPDAVRALVAGNPPRSLDPTTGKGSDDNASETPSPTAEPSPGDSDSDDSSTSDAEDDALVRAGVAGATWLERLHTGLEDSEILTLPYGDVDVDGAAAHDVPLYRTARKRSGDSLAPWGLSTSPAVSSPSGYVSPAAIRMTEPDATILTTDRMFRKSAPTVAHADGRTLVVASSAAATGGPGPDDPLAPIAMRQRILSEAALRLLTHGRQPLVVSFPSTWIPSSPAEFFSGLDVPWLHLTTLSAVRERQGRTVTDDALDYPETQRRLQLAKDSFDAADTLVRSGQTLENLLTLNDQVADTVQDEALTDVSYADRPSPWLSRGSADRSRRWIEQRLRSVHVDAPKAVILSSGSGRFSATITNNLDQPVSVKLDAVPDPPLRVFVPGRTVDIGPGSRTTVLLNASSSAIGIRNVTLLLTDSAGTPTGSSDHLPIRSNRVSNVIWVILGTGVALLFGAIFVRLFRRIWAARRA